jgi:hypothetical protein
MFKFLLYLFVFYVVFRFIFGKLFGVTVKSKVFTYQAGKPQYTNKKEGEIHIDTDNAKRGYNNKNIGEYVDYEEIK